MRSRERHENWVRVFHVFLAFSREGLQRSGVRLVREEFAGNVGPAYWEAPCTYPAYEVCCSCTSYRGGDPRGNPGDVQSADGAAWRASPWANPSVSPSGRRSS